MTKALTERDLLESQIKIYDFYAGLIDRAVGGGRLARLPRWDEERAQEYKRLADELRARLAELDANEAAAPEMEPEADSRPSDVQSSGARTQDPAVT